MTAPSLNAASTVPPGAAAAAGANAGKSAAAGNPLAGFEALLAALFPAAQPGAAPTAASPLAPTTDGKLVVEGKPDDAGEQGADPDAAADTDATDVQGLIACGLVIPQPADGQLPLAKAPAADGQPRQVVNFAANAADHAAPALPGKAELAPEAADAAEDAAAALADANAKTPAAKPADTAPPAWGRAKAAGAPAQPALENANPKADLAAKAADAQADAPVDVPTPPAAAATSQAADAAKLPTTPALAAKPEPAPVKTAKSERSKGETASVDALKPKEAVDRPVHAQAADAAAKTASATTEAAEQPDAGEAKAKAEADPTEATPQGETRSTTASTGPAAHAAHQVRGAPETVANLAAQIIKKLEAKTTRFDLELDPHGMGRVDVRVEIGAHGKMTASMVFENPQAAHELKSRAAELQRQLEQAGFDLSGGLSFDVADQGRQQGQPWQDQADNGRAFRGQAFRAALETAGDAAETANLGALRLRRGVTAGVDVRI